MGEGVLLVGVFGIVNDGAGDALFMVAGGELIIYGQTRFAEWRQAIVRITSSDLVVRQAAGVKATVTSPVTTR
jgi:hypothetical protein